ncbi:MAG: helical backbone metal receptor, partial [Solirubrobacteraceae bacterium]
MSAAAAVRAVSLVPSVTETLRAWGVIPVGVTRFCDAPGVERVGGTKNPDIEAIVALAPDVVVMDREENRAEDAAALEGRGVRVHALHVRSLADVQRELNVLANVVGHEAPTPGPAAASGELSEPAPSGIAVRAFVPIWR